MRLQLRELKKASLKFYYIHRNMYEIKQSFCTFQANEKVNCLRHERYRSNEGYIIFMRPKIKAMEEWSLIFLMKEMDTQEQYVRALQIDRPIQMRQDFYLSMKRQRKLWQVNSINGEAIKTHGSELHGQVKQAHAAKQK